MSNIWLKTFGENWEKTYNEYEMKEFDWIKLKVDYVDNNVEKGCHGLVLKVGDECSQVLMFNDKIGDDYAIFDVKNSDLKVLCYKLPKTILQKLKPNIQNVGLKFEKNSFRSMRFKEFDQVRLVVDKDKYNDYGVFAGDEGIVAIDYEAGGEILVDFVSVDDDMQVHGDCISVDIDDLELVSSEK